jgi:protein disulfide-isomerase A6
MKIANERIGGGSSGSHGGHSHGGDSGGIDEKDVIVLTDSNFEDNVYGDSSAWFVEFYAPWCGHCKSLAPEWAELATNLKGEVKVAKVDATENKAAA